MKTSRQITEQNQAEAPRYALRRQGGFWQITFAGRSARFKHEQGALYVACLLLDPPREPIHAVALVLKAREVAARPGNREQLLEELNMGLEEAAAVRALWHKQRELEGLLADRHVIEPVKAEALRELEEVTEFLRQSPWLSHHGAERCADAVSLAIRRFYAHLAGAVDPDGKPDAVLRAFAEYIHAHLLLPSGRGLGCRRGRLASVLSGCFTYEPPRGLVWRVEAADRERPAAVDYLSSLLCAGLVGAVLAMGCAVPKPLKGGKAELIRRPAGVIEQTLTQGENASQPTSQDQESVRVRTYTVPAGSRLETVPAAGGVAPAWSGMAGAGGQECPRSSGVRGKGGARSCTQPSSPDFLARRSEATAGEPSTSFMLSAPMAVTEREESRARTELGAAQKDMARELGARLSSLKGIVWVGAALFVFGLASLAWPPLKTVIGSVTTSAALMLGGVALMVLPSLVVGHELVMLGIVTLGVGGWFLAHRHGQLRGMVAASTAAGAGASSP